MDTSNYFHQPNIDPVLFHLYGPLAIRWYSLLYVGGFVIGGWLMKRLAREDRFKLTPTDAERLTMWVLLGAVIGARVIYCVVYDPGSLLANPFYLFEIYRGGLSFHGGILGAMVAAWMMAREKKISFWNITDLMVICTPIGLGMGRLGNFINGELYGRVTTVPWGVVFRHGGPLPRHPSQLYEFFFEGVVLFLVLFLGRKHFKKDGQLSLIFIVGYSLIRFFVEFFREPDAHLGYLLLGLSMGQILSLVTAGIAIAVAGYNVKQSGQSKPIKKRKKY